MDVECLVAPSVSQTTPQNFAFPLGAEWSSCDGCRHGFEIMRMAQDGATRTGTSMPRFAVICVLR